MTFNSVYQLLIWFCNKNYIRPPKGVGNHDLLLRFASPHMDNAEEVYTAYNRIHDILDEELTNREFLITKDLFKRGSRQKDIEHDHAVSWRTIKHLKQKLQDLHSKFKDNRLIYERYEKPKYV